MWPVITELLRVQQVSKHVQARARTRRGTATPRLVSATRESRAVPPGVRSAGGRGSASFLRPSAPRRARGSGGTGRWATPRSRTAPHPPITAPNLLPSRLPVPTYRAGRPVSSPALPRQGRSAPPRACLHPPTAVDSGQPRLPPRALVGSARPPSLPASGFRPHQPGRAHQRMNHTPDATPNATAVSFFLPKKLVANPVNLPAANPRSFPPRVPPPRAREPHINAGKPVASPSPAPLTPLPETRSWSSHGTTTNCRTDVHARSHKQHHQQRRLCYQSCSIAPFERSTSAA
ncbi:hypothetical protein PAHAL_4G113200 [Panicum hallii]|uniref:Uncharacterized protein n=1 Tax=Panicum hallii TaxID=206008 RepID=A0A2T8JCM5_9POAL|nr:hypothetical protein PAHAL_4G113200 [Panicum hallii]